MGMIRDNMYVHASFVRMSFTVYSIAGIYTAKYNIYKIMHKLRRKFNLAAKLYIYYTA